MATAVALFSNFNITKTTADAGRVVNSQLDWMSIGIDISAVSGTNPSAEFRLQWSFDNVTWADGIPRDVIGTATAPVSVIARFPVKAPYWRLVVVVSGTSPSFTCTANALI
ncbi:hypothetical protein [Arthrobacter sp. B3I4]|uniref:hypothetical protein n=1 Tax=Arthrobacter sp. B3I4 TaxID=3042267 RepID=UPI002788CDF2|nr:hypothetical protein [Arthrobacter sp. B3I4]MDQ0756067.1 hypothetical protein [Arthrobacter sp. B3I4]